MQELTICSPEKATCVGKVNLKDETCLVPCDGLYADIVDVDDSLKQKMTKGKYIRSLSLVLLLLIIISFPRIGSYWWQYAP